MPRPEHGLRPAAETFEYAGCQVSVVGFDEIVAAAADQPVDLLHDAALPSVIANARLSISAAARDGQPAYLLDTSMRIGREPQPAFGVLGRDPVGVLLARRAAAGDDWAIRVVDGVGAAVSEVSRWLGRDRPGSTSTAREDEPVRSVVRTDPATGLRATVTYHRPPSRFAGGGPLVTAQAAVPSGQLSPKHLVAMLGVVLDVAGRAAGGERPHGEYVLSRYPMGPSSAADAAERVTLDQVGGLDAVVAQFRQIAVSFRHPQVMARWGARRPQGILLYGPPGTGKTMLARALAAEIGATFREIRTPEILDKWLGGSERNIKRIFRDARRYREPTVMLFDEFDSIISYTGAGMDAASQAINAVAGIFKQEMNDLIEENPNVIVVATTNFPERVDDSLVRSGRFDIKLAIPQPDHTGRAQIIAKMIRQLMTRHETAGFRMFADDIDVDGLATASAGMTGADLKEALRRAQLAKAMQEARTGVAATPINQHDIADRIAELRHATTR
ncbi:ATP-binding protein [Micromonospora sp. CPCC 206061]|uniref:ATP-binding protein n=1 Tax=Micromonospora sp. CPCC 206061 TaxID=3122410 RepID=UPI002FEEDB04